LGILGAASIMAADDAASGRARVLLGVYNDGANVHTSAMLRIDPGPTPVDAQCDRHVRDGAPEGDKAKCVLKS
jgi:hypothetical protein